MAVSEGPESVSQAGTFVVVSSSDSASSSLASGVCLGDRRTARSPLCADWFALRRLPPPATAGRGVYPAIVLSQVMSSSVKPGSSCLSITFHCSRAYCLQNARTMVAKSVTVEPDIRPSPFHVLVSIACPKAAGRDLSLTSLRSAK